MALKTKMENEIKGLNLELDLVIEEAKDKKGNIIYIGEGKDREPNYSRHDPIALLNIISAYDTKKGTLKQYKSSLKLREKVEIAWRNDSKKLGITLDEATFLKDHFNSFFDEKRTDRISVPLLWGKTMVKVLEQLE